MINENKAKPTWKRTLSIERGLRQQDREDAPLGADITATCYRTMLSMGTEKRVQICCYGEPIIEIHQTDKGYIVVEIQGIQAEAVRVILTPLPSQQIKHDELDGFHFDIE